MRYTVTGELDPELFAEVERERHMVGLSRSATIRQGLEWWVLARKEQGEERIGRAETRHRQVMRRLEYVVGMIRQQERAAEQEAETAARRNGTRPAGVSPEDPVDGYREAESEDMEPHRSALDEARKRARRRAE